MISETDILIVGAGSSGIIAGIVAARKGAKVVICEQLSGPGTKLLASGGGRCNLTNTLPADEFYPFFGREGRFMLPALKAFGSCELRDFMKKLGISTITSDGFHVFPSTQKSSDILDALISECVRSGVKICAETEVLKLMTERNQVGGVLAGNGKIISKKVVLSTGGKSYPSLGSSGKGYAIAREVGHMVVNPVPALVDLKTLEKWTWLRAGLALKTVRISTALPGVRNHTSEGDILFTHTGISGPATLNISGFISELLVKHKKVPIKINFLPGSDFRSLTAEFDKWRKNSGKKRISRLLSEKIPRSLAEVFCACAGCPDAEAAKIPRITGEKIAGMICSCPLTVTGTGGFEKAMVTRGGISLKDVDSETLESRIVKGLYFAGEILNLDGPCGGFNLQWAFSSGWLAGSSSVFN